MYLVSGSDASKPHRSPRRRDGRAPGRRTRDADVRGSPAVVHAGCKPACRERNPGHAQTGLPLPAGLCVARIPVHTRATRGHDRSPTADGRARPRRTIREDPRRIRDSCLTAVRHEPRRPPRSRRCWTVRRGIHRPPNSQLPTPKISLPIRPGIPWKLGVAERLGVDRFFILLAGSVAVESAAAPTTAPPPGTARDRQPKVPAAGAHHRSRPWWPRLSPCPVAHRL